MYNQYRNTIHTAACQPHRSQKGDNTSATTIDINTLIKEITPALTRKLYKLVSDQNPLEDLFQTAVCKIIEKCATTPDFINQKPAYIIKFGYWNARHRIDAGQTYTKYVASLNDFRTGQDDDGEELDILDIIPDNSYLPENEVVSRERLSDLVGAIKKLSPDNRAIVAMIYSGYPEADIAAKLHISRPAVSQRKATIARQLGQLGAIL